MSIAALGLVGAAVAAERVSVHVQRKPLVRQNVHLTFRARPLPNGG